MNPAIHGLWPAMLTPLQANGSLDTARAVAHAQRLLQADCDGVCLFGTTGEGLAFTVDERKALLSALLQAGVRADQCVVNISALALNDAVALGRHACAHGVFRQMFMPPFYFKAPSDAGVIAAVSQVIAGIDAAALRLVLYHFPAISSYAFSHDCVAQLASTFPQQVVGLKDSSANLPHSQGLAQAFPALSILVGAEPHVAPTQCVGGAGSINGLGNIAPALMKRIMSAPDTVAPVDNRLMNGLLGLLNLFPNQPFVPSYKAMLAEQTGDEGWTQVRAPLTPLDNTEAQAVRAGYRTLAQTHHIA